MESIRHVENKPSLEALIAAGERRKRERPEELEDNRVEEVKPEEVKMESSQPPAKVARVTKRPLT
eukprot:5102921-Amphidinium_carterae.1